MASLFDVIRHEPTSFIWYLPFRIAIFAIRKYILHQKFLVRPIHGHVMILRLDDPGISRTLILIGDREREHRFIMEKLVMPGNVVLDLGANIGYYVLLESKLTGSRGRVIAVEPHPDNFSLLMDNVRLNKVTNVSTAHAAVTPRDGTATLHVSQLANVHSLIDSSHRRQTGEVIEVPAVSLETLRNQYGNIDFIRMDIEGYEQYILDDVVNINRNSGFAPTILFELHPKEYDLNKFLRTIAQMFSLGYSIPYLASSKKSHFDKANIKIAATVHTDGRIRYIGQDIPLDKLPGIIKKSRCLALQHATSRI